MKDHILNSLQEAQSALSNLLENEETIGRVAQASQVILESLDQGGRIFSCGNGGSMCDAIHFAEELSGRYRLDRRGLPAVSISDPGHLSCVGNDFGYEFVFSRYLESHARAGDCLLAISTSGSSQNALKAAEIAHEMGLKVIALTGRSDAKLGKLADIHICTPGGQFADRVQELHIKVIHILIELIERDLFPENYA